jgi:predicted  nucleic acid-binding Zn-ribbon protein
MRKMKMKNYFIIMLAALPFFYGCENKKQTERIMSLQADSLRLTRLVDDKDATINSLFQTLNEIEENLAAVRAKEALIADQTADQQEMKADVKERINQSISEINELMDKNKQLINRLNAQVCSSNLKIAELNKAIERMEETIAAKEKEIAELRENLARLNVQIETLNNKVADLEKESKQKDEVIDQKINEMNKAWYVVGDRRDLRDKGIINREGGFIFIGIVTTPAENLIHKEFKEIDLREMKEIPVNANRAEIITVHPEGSYEFIGDRPVEKLVITNPQEFWKASNYLVISTR